MRHRVGGGLVVLALMAVATVPGCTTRTPEAAPQRAGEGDGFQGTLQAVVVQRPQLDPAVVHSISATPQGNFDRFAIEFATTMVPGFDVQYVNPAHQCATGDIVTVRGARTLVVRLTPAQAHTDAGAPTIAAAQQPFDLPAIKEVRLACDFEGEVSWVIGVAAEAQYRVSELRDPPRLLIDIKH
jgi:hypothetical protein